MKDNFEDFVGRLLAPDGDYEIVEGVTEEEAELRLALAERTQMEEPKRTNTCKELPITNREKEYWQLRWAWCSPATYPPEIKKVVEVTTTSGFWIFKQTYTHTYSICRLCGDDLVTGHYCREVME